MTIQQDLQQAMHLHQTGRLAEAETVYRRILQLDPGNADANHLLGVIAHHGGNPGDAEALIREALKHHPNSAAARNNLGNVLRDLGRLAEAEESYRISVKLAPRVPEPLNNLGCTLKDLGRLDEAEEVLHQAVAIKPDYVEALNNLGSVLRQAGRLGDAQRSYYRALALKPDDADAHFNLANLLLESGRLEDALKGFRRAVDLDENHVSALHNLGTGLIRARRPQEAERCFRRVLDLEANHADALHNLGSVLASLGQPDEAETCLRRAVAIRPDDAAIHNGLGNFFMARGDTEEAEACFRGAVELDQDFQDAHANLADLLAEIGQLDEARAGYERELALTPGSMGPRIKQAFLMPIFPASPSAISDIRAHFAEDIEGLTSGGGTVENPLKEIGRTPFYLAYHDENDAPLMQRLARMHTTLCPDLEWTAEHCLNPKPRDAQRRVRVGFVSMFFHGHTIGKLTLGIIENIDRDLVDLRVFMTRDKVDSMSRAIEAAAEKTVFMDPDLDSARRAIAAEELDVLFYPDIGMHPFTYFLAFSRLAPVQAVSWGHPVSTGIPAMDYFLSAEDLEPEGAEEDYSETLIRLGHLPTCYSRPFTPEPADDRTLFGFPDDATLYLCPQTLFKLHPDFDAVLGHILRRDANGRIVLIAGNHRGWDEALKARFAKAFPDQVDRVLFIPRMSGAKFMHLLRAADATLDPPTFSGGNTTFEAFNLGVPIVTWPSGRMRGRVTYACYKAMGLDDLVADSAETYVNLALRLANDVDFHQTMAARIREHSHRLFDNTNAVRHMERFFVEAAKAGPR
jgi:protein O-GlcNAc transferase